MQRLRIADHSIVFAEVPGEISLAITISGCEHRCPECHSKHLWEYYGKYLSDSIDGLLSQYADYVTCVCFLGGDQNLSEMKDILVWIKENTKLKTCLYSGENDISLLLSVLSCLDYVKIGSYISALGGLTSLNTNQRFYKKTGTEFIDITQQFYIRSQQ